MATAINKDSGVLCAKPNVFGGASTSFEVVMKDNFFIGQDNIIQYSPLFRKYLKEEFEQDNEDDDAAIPCEIDLAMGSNFLMDKPGTLSFDCLLDYLKSQRSITKKDLFEIVYNSDIVCRRGVLNKLINAPYSGKAEFQFAVKKFRGVYFIKEISTETYQKQNVRRIGDIHCYLPKFKNHVIKPFGDANYVLPEDPTTWEQLQGIFTGEFSDKSDGSKRMKIYYGSEIDAFDQNDKLVEIKLQSGGFNDASPFFSDKLRKWYFQSELVTSKSIMVGIRQEAVVSSVQHIKNEVLRSMVPMENRWDSKVSYSSAMNVLSSACDFYERNVKPDETLVIELVKKTQQVVYHVRDDKVHKILPSDFKEAFDEEHTPVSYSAQKRTAKPGYVIATTTGWLDNVVKSALGN